MARVRIILEDDNGQLINDRDERVYNLGTGLGRLDDIEMAVTRFRAQALPDLQADLLTSAQEQALAQEKKRLPASAMA